MCGLVLRCVVEGRWSARSCSRSSVRSDLVRLFNLRTEPVFLPIENISLSHGRQCRETFQDLRIQFRPSARARAACTTVRVQVTSPACLWIIFLMSALACSLLG